MAYDNAKMQYLRGKTIDELLIDNRSYFIPYNDIKCIEFYIVVQKVLFSTINYILVKVKRNTGSQPELMIPRSKLEKLDEIEKYLRPIFREKSKITK